MKAYSTLKNRVSIARYRFRNLQNRAVLAWAVLSNQISERQGQDLSYLGEQASHCHGIEYVSASAVLESVQDQYGDDPRFAQLVKDAVARVASKWCSDGHIAGAAEDWAIEIFTRYAEEAGIELCDQYDLELASAAQ